MSPLDVFGAVSAVLVGVCGFLGLAAGVLVGSDA